MVIPLPGGVPLAGPPPPELAQQFIKIRMSVMAMLAGVTGKIVAGAVLMGLLPAVVSSLNLILVTVMGVFMLRDDPQIAPVYNCLVTSCCQPCAQLFGGGMSCLMPFVLCNFLTVVLDLIGGQAIGIIATSVSLMWRPEAWQNPLGCIAFLVLALSSLASEVGMMVGTYFGWQAYKQAAGIDGTMPGGGGGGYMPLSGPGGYNPPSFQPSAPPAPPAPRTGGGPQTFRPFEGTGHTLGR
mmetsp:Transcript_83934/g.216011  ORF Transcript_83934/g.216011 Transcript_83934/m.216011 type:complete len:239 (+) Transcript_83934:88-804(+)